MKKGCLFGCLGSTSLVLLGGVYLFQKARTAPQVGENFAALTPQQKTVRREEAKQLETQVKEVARAARNKEKKPFTIVATESQLNTLLQDRIDTAKFPIRDLRAGLEPNELILQGHVSTAGIEATATISGNITAVDGAPRYEIDSVQIEGIPAGGLRNKAQKQVNKALEKWREEMPGRIDSVQIEKGKMTLHGQTD